jgi:hypothetical protein
MKHPKLYPNQALSRNLGQSGKLQVTLKNKTDPQAGLGCIG